MENPAVSVLISAYNAAPYLTAAVDSILAQTLQDFEILIVDDGSSDDTWGVATSFSDPRVKCWRQDNKGKAAALNRMLGEAAGEFIVIQDADDVSDPCRLERLVDALRRSDELAAVFSGFSLLIDGHTVAPRERGKSPDECRQDIARFRMPAHDPTMACRTTIARRLQFDETLRIGQGGDFVLRLGEKYPIAVLREDLYRYRILPTSVTRSKIDLRTASVRRVLDKARQRRGLKPLTDDEFAKFYGRAANDPNNNLIGHLCSSVYHQRNARHWLSAAQTATLGLSVRPLSSAVLKPLIYAFAPWPLIQWIRGRRRR